MRAATYHVFEIDASGLALWRAICPPADRMSKMQDDLISTALHYRLSKRAMRVCVAGLSVGESRRECAREWRAGSERVSRVRRWRGMRLRMRDGRRRALCVGCCRQGNTVVLPIDVPPGRQ